MQSDAVNVQTTNGARSGLITRDTIEEISTKGRDFAGLLKLLPGVVDTRNREAPGWESMNNLTINGRASFNFSYDGVTNKDTGQNAGNFAAPALDSIAEVRVQASNFQAEYGRSSGATMTVVTRSGSRDFRGSAAFYKRDDSLNGNEYSRRILCADAASTVQSAALQVRQLGVDPRRTRAYSEDLVQSKPRQAVLLLVAGSARTHRPGTLNQRRVPTALERQGDFSQTFDNLGRPVFIRDPLLAGNCAATTGGPACFAGNRIPS